MSRVAVIGLVGESVFLRLDKHQEVGETAHATDIHREWGGKGYNQAVAAARYGAEVTFLGAASKEDRESIIKAAEADGIRARIVGKSLPSSYGVIATDSTGDNRVTVYAGAELEAADVELIRANIEAADVLLINNEVPEDVNVSAVEIAKASGVKVILNPAPVRNICKYLLSNCDIFTPNEHEYAALGEMDNVIVTLGSAGCRIGWLGIDVPTVKVSAVDTTGAGDTFSGVLAAAIGEESDVVGACRIANAAASLEVLERYVMPAIPYRCDVEKNLSQKK